MKRSLFIKSIALLTAGFSVALKRAWSFTNKCHTGQDVSGPFHRSGAPFRTDLTDKTHPPDARIAEVRGTVYADDCTTPLPDALLDLWQANPSGEYDMTSGAFKGRARLKTDKAGKYYFKTYIPGHYTDAGLNRPNHIHFIVTAPKHKNLTTQMYFKGDDRMGNDPFVNRNDGYKRAMDYTKDDNGIYQVAFDIYMMAE